MILEPNRAIKTLKLYLRLLWHMRDFKSMSKMEYLNPKINMCNQGFTTKVVRLKGLDLGCFELSPERYNSYYSNATMGKDFLHFDHNALHKYAYS